MPTREFKTAPMRLAQGIASPHFGEYALSTHAFLWGLAQILTAGIAINPTQTAANYTPDEIMLATLGIWPLLTGALGLFAVARRERSLRLVSSLCIVPFWAVLAAYYCVMNPPLTGGVVTYGLAAIGELIVYVRVRHGFDRWAVIDPRVGQAT